MQCKSKLTYLTQNRLETKQKGSNKIKVEEEKEEKEEEENEERSHARGILG